MGAASTWGFGRCVPSALGRAVPQRALTLVLAVDSGRSDASPPHRAAPASDGGATERDSPGAGVAARAGRPGANADAQPEVSVSPRAAWPSSRPGGDADPSEADGPVRCVSPASCRPMSSAGARMRGGGGAAAASAAALPVGARGGNPLLRASNVALPTDFPELPPAAARRSVAFRTPPASPPAAAGEDEGELEVLLMPSSSDDDAGGEAADRPAPLPLPLSAFGPRPLSRDPEMEAKLAASARAEATLSAHDVALIARMSGPLRRVTLRPATAGPAASAYASAGPSRFDASGGRPMAAASQWNWGGTAEAGADDDSDDDLDDSASQGGVAAAVVAPAPRAGRSSVGGGGESPAVVRPAGRQPSRNATFPRQSSGRGSAAEFQAASAEPEPTDSPRAVPRRSSSSGSGGGLARAGERIARNNAANAAAAAAPPAETPPRAAWPPPAPRPSPGVAPQRPFTAAAHHGPRSRSNAAAATPAAAPSAELESFLARQEAYNKLYREKAARLRAAEEEAASGAAAHRPAVNARSRRLLEAHPAPSLVGRLGEGSRAV